MSDTATPTNSIPIVTAPDGGVFLASMIGAIHYREPRNALANLPGSHLPPGVVIQTVKGGAYGYDFHSIYDAFMELDRLKNEWMAGLRQGGGEPAGVFKVNDDD